MFPFFVARNVSYRSSGQICPKILGPGVFKKKANKFSWLEMFQHFCGQKCSTVFFLFFRGRLDSQKTLLAGECPKFTRPDLFQSFFGLKWSLRHASFESGHEILSCDYLLTCRLSVVLRPD